MKYMRILDYASELGLITIVHTGIDIGFPDHVRCTPMMIRRVLDEVAPEKLVLAHYGGFKMWEEAGELIAGKNVYLDTAYLFDFIEDDLFLQILKKHGADRVLFATDSPWSGQKESLSHLKGLSIPNEDLDKILGGNACELLNL